ncbi:MAG: SPOR domain-containing protein [Erythrobacter sp.]|nr:SPOR domain-containing protein [Erythrobacter sp.]
MTYPAGDPEDEQDGEAAMMAEEQLALDDDDDGLPWLEDDTDYDDEGAFDARLIWYGLLGLLVIGAVLLGAWWLTRERADPELAADGSTIEAPDGHYKERPADPGGREVEGTGDTAYAVAEGETQRGILIEEDLPEPSIDRDQSGTPAPAPSASASAAAASGAVHVQIGAFTSRADAEAAWASATTRYSVLSGMSHRIVEGEVNGARVYRLQAIAGDRAAGDATCRAIRNSGGDCYIR